jgi:hypothetical protein
MSEATTAKVNLKTKDIEFNAEGDPEWLAKQLDKVLAANAAPSSSTKPGR